MPDDLIDQIDVIVKENPDTNRSQVIKALCRQALKQRDKNATGNGVKK
jgi:metal-responsive CopG/Arc/MetJ family transcriptional regulator